MADAHTPSGTAAVRPLRTLLFVPASRPERIDKALASGADAVIVDLEDAVAPDDKATARGALADWLGAAQGSAPPPASALTTAGAPAAALWIRINAAETPWFEADLALVARPGVAGVMVPKSENSAALAVVRAAGARALMPLIESAAGFDALDEIASSPGVERLAFGSIDLQVDLGMRDAHEDELLWFRTQVVMASRRAGLAAPVDGVTTAIDDAEAMRTDVLRARRLGFAAKLCIHPKQVEPVRTHFAPSAAEVAWARRVLAADAASGGAAVSVDGKMVDKPVILRAQAIVQEAA